MELYPRALELGIGLDEVARVGPQADMVLGNHEVSLAGVAGHPGDLVPAGRGIFAVVGVVTGQYHHVPSPRPHHVPDCSDPGLGLIHTV